CFTSYWTNDTCVAQEDRARGPMISTGSNFFRRMGVRGGDLVYVFTIGDGVVHLIGRMQVDRVVSRGSAVRELGTRNLWDVADWCLSTPEKATVERFDIAVPLGVTRRLRFVVQAGRETGIAFVDAA